MGHNASCWSRLLLIDLATIYSLVTGGTSNLAGPSGVLFLSLKSNCPDLWHNSSKLFFYTGQLSSDDSYALNTLGVITKNLSFLLDSVPFEFPYFTNGIFSKFIPFRLSELGFDAIWFDSDQICINDISPVITRSTSDLLFVDGGIKVSGQFRDITRESLPLLNILISISMLLVFVGTSIF